MAKARSRVIDIEVTARAQRQDAELAMGSDPLNAVIELVTNSDDAYLALGSPRRGKIRIAVERHRHKPTRITISDRAGGMSQSELEERLGAVGRRTSGFETGAERRGLFGRGAKDIVHFGQAEWESVKDGRCSYLRLIFDGRFTGKAEIGPKRLPSDRKDGTDARLDVEPRFTVPQHDTLLRKLRNHYALRPILQDARREILLVDVSRNRTDRVRFEPPKGTQIVDETLPIPGYPGQSVTLSLHLSDEPLAEEREDREYWRHSILITSGRAAYEIFDGGRFARDPYGYYLRRLWGHASVPGIGDLIRSFDDAEDAGGARDEGNPIRLVRRDRKGLVPRKAHSFVDALYGVLEQALEPHLEKMKKAAEDAVGRIDEGTRQRWDEAGSALAKLMEEEEGDGEGVEGRLPPFGLSLIPQVRIVEPEANARISIRYRPPMTDPPTTEAPVVEILQTDENNDQKKDDIRLENRGGYFSGTCTVTGTGRKDGAVVQVAARIGTEEKTSLVEWTHRPDPEIDHLMFQSASFAVKDGQERRITLWSPWDLVTEGDGAARLAITGSPNITLSGGRLEQFVYDEKRELGRCAIRVRGHGVGSRAKLVATLGDQEAETEIRVTTAGVAGIRVELESAKHPHRARLVPGGTLFLNTREPIVSRYLGAKSRNYPGQQTIPFNVMLAEIMVEAASRFVLQRSSEPISRAELFGRHEEQMSKWLPKIHRVLVPRVNIHKSHGQ